MMLAQWVALFLSEGMRVFKANRLCEATLIASRMIANSKKKIKIIFYKLQILLFKIKLI